MNNSSCCPRICFRGILDDPLNAVPLNEPGQYFGLSSGELRNINMYWHFLSHSLSSSFLKSLFGYGQKCLEHSVLGDEAVGQEGSNRPKED